MQTLNAMKNKINQLLSRQSLDEHHCRALLIDLYDFAEQQGKGGQCPQLKFYRDLSVHSSLDRKSCAEKLKKIEEQFAIPENIRSTSDVIAEQFSVRMLQEEILAFEKEIPKLIIFKDKKNWIAFMRLIFKNFLDKPLLQKDQNSQLESLCFQKDDSNKVMCVMYIRNSLAKIICSLKLDYL